MTRARFVFVILAACNSALWAQAEPATTVPAEAPTTAPVVLPASGPVVPASGPVVAGNGQVMAASGPTTVMSIVAATQPATTRLHSGPVVLNFKDAPLDSVLNELSEIAGFVVVKEVPRIDGRVTLVSKQPVTPEEAVALLNTVLKTNGYAAIQMDRILKIVPRDKARKANIPVRAGADPAKVDKSDELITQVIPIRFADAAQLKQDLTPLVGPDADFTANASSNSIIITDTSANVRRVVEIISSLDTHMAEAVEVKVFQLKNASAANAARLIMEVFKDDQASGGQQQQQQRFPFPIGGRGGFNFGGQGAPGGQGTQAGQGARRQVKINAAADDRTNTLVVTGPRDTLVVVESVVEKLDADPISEQSVFIYNLKNGKAQNIEATVNLLFNGTTSSGPRGGTQQQQTLQRSNATGFGGTGSGLGGTGSGSAMGRSTNTNANSRTGGNTNARTNTNTARGVYGGGAISPAAAAAASQISGGVTVVADYDTNSLLVMTNPKNFDRVKQVLDELDRPIPQVLVKVLIAEVTHDSGEDIGAQFSILNLRSNGNGQTLGTDFGLANQTGGMVLRVLETQLTATLRALETAGKLDVLSRPYILTSDNQLAQITVGQSVPFITNTRTTDTGQTINTIQYQDIGIIVDVTPHINPEGLVILDIAPEISALTGSSVPISETVNAPIYAKRSAQSRVGIKDGQTIVIGGLMEDRKTETISKVPILGDIPLAGGLFRRKQMTKSKTELLIFLTPHVASRPESLEPMSQQEKQGLKIVPKAVEPGAYEEHLKGLQRGAATQPLP